MSNNESFIDEVTEEVRRDRLLGAIRKYGWIGIVVVLGLVGAAGWTEYDKSRDAAAAQAAGDALLSALDKQEPAERLAALQALPQSALTGLLAGAAALETEDTAAAIVAFDAVAADTAVPQIYRDIAAFKAAMARAPEQDAAARIAAFETLAQPGAPLRHLAKEQIALAQISAGDRDAALATLDEIVNDAEVAGDVKGRAQGLKVALGAGE